MLTTNLLKFLSRNKNNFDSKKFKNKVKELDWHELYEQTDVNVACNMFSEPLVKILDDMAPLQKIQIRKSFTPWVSDDTKSLMKARDEDKNESSKFQPRGRLGDLQSSQKQVHG